MNLWAAVITLSALRRMELLLHPLTSLWCSPTVELTHRSTDSFSYMSHFCYIICEQNISVCAVQFYADDAALYVPLINRRSMRLSVSVAGCKMLSVVSKTHFTADKNPPTCANTWFLSSKWMCTISIHSQVNGLCSGHRYFSLRLQQHQGEHLFWRKVMTCVDVNAISHNIFSYTSLFEQCLNIVQSVLSLKKIL